MRVFSTHKKVFLTLLVRCVDVALQLRLLVVHGGTNLVGDESHGARRCRSRRPGGAQLPRRRPTDGQGVRPRRRALSARRRLLLRGTGRSECAAALDGLGVRCARQSSLASVVIRSSLSSAL